jgi:hypothetical protein
MSFSDPLLCLTVSATIRDKPVPLTGPRQRLAELINAVGGLQLDQTLLLTPRNKRGAGADEDELHGLEEVNLLDGLSSCMFARSSF